MTTFTFSLTLEATGDFGCLEIDCEMEYEAAGGDGWHEPRYASSVTLCSAKIGSAEIYDALTKEQVAYIEQAAAVDYDETRRQADEDHAAEAYWERAQERGGYGR